MNLKESFDQAVIESKALTKRPDNDILLKLYSLYKQATEGDIDPTANPPGMFDFVASAKHNAWLKLKGLSTDEAMQQYLDVFNGLKQAGY